MADGNRKRLTLEDGAVIELEHDGANAEFKKQSSDSQLDAADPRASVWVSANAGTGKTHTLTSRVARLLLSGTKPEHILCLTFTRAAAAQMQTKLYERLGRWSTMEEAALAEALFHLEGRHLTADEIAKARRLFASALETPGGLKIQTIHAFCESLLGRFPLEAGVSPHFALADDRQSAELMAAARDTVLQQSTDKPETPLAHAIALLAGEADETAFETLLGEVTGARHKIRKLITQAQGIDAAERLVAEALGTKPGETPGDIITAALADIDPEHLRTVAGALATGKSSDTDKANLLNTFAADMTAENYAAVYTPVFLTQKDEPRSSMMTKDLVAAFPDIHTWLVEEQARVHERVRVCRAAQTAIFTGAVLRVGCAVLDAYEAEKERLGLLDYEDLITRTADLLSSRKATQWVLYKLDMGLDHILVDEAQDTSPQQWQVVEALVKEFFSGEGARSYAPGDETRAGPGARTLFAVGDEKQSIFSFQGADPGEFARRREAFSRMATNAGQVWRNIPLTVSWRTAQEILSGVDAAFEAAAMRDGVVAGDDPIHHESVWTGRAGLVELWPPVTDDEVDKKELWEDPLDAVNAASKEAKLARRIVSKLKDWIGKEYLPQRGRVMQAGDVLILVRRRGPFVNELIRQLKTQNIPVAGVDRLVLGDHIAIMDLMALARFAVLPEDDLTLATLLRSPFCTVSEEGLFALSYNRKGTLWESLRANADSVEGGADALDFLTQVRARAGFGRPHEFFARILGPMGGRAALVARLGMDVHDPIDEFLNQTLAYESAHTPSLQGFIAWMDASPTEIKRDLDQGGNQVRIMTVHGAKGLEANVVILPDTVQAGGTPGRSSLVTHEDGLVTYSPRKGDADEKSLAARQAREAREDEEYRRLLYVAMTRAMDRLYIAAAHGPRGMGPVSWYVRVRDALSRAGHAVEAEVEFADGPATVLRLESQQLVEAARDEKETADTATIILPDWVHRAAPAEPAQPGPLSPSSMPDVAQNEPPAMSPATGGPQEDAPQRFARGRLVHTLLQHLPDATPVKRRGMALAYLEKAARGTFDAAAQAAMVDEVMAVLDDPQFAPLFAPGSRAEVALAGRISWRGRSLPVSGQIDRLAVSGDTVLIADYKTNRPPPARSVDVAPVYLDQMAAYRALVAAAYPGLDIKCALVWTDGPRLMMLPDDVLAARGT